LTNKKLTKVNRELKSPHMRFRISLRVRKG